MSENQRLPRGLGPAGKKLYRAITSEFELEEHELAVLLEAARTVDNLAQLDAIVQREGVTNVSPQGVRAHPALVEARQQRVTLAKLFAALKIKEDDVPTGGRRSR